MAQNYQLQKTGQEIDDLLQKIDDLGPASSGGAGTMSAEDKAKLDDIETGAERNVIEGIVLGETSLTPSASKTVTIPVDSEPAEGSENPVASGGVYDALGGKMNKDTSAGENDIAVFNDEGQVVGAFDVNEVVREGRIKQTTGQSTTDLMSQKAVTDALDTKAAKDGDAVEGNLAKFDANGNPVDAGIAAEKVAQKGEIQTYSGNLVDTRSAGTAQEFTYRKSGGDGVNWMRRIKGKSLVWNQLVNSKLTGWSATGFDMVAGTDSITLTKQEGATNLIFRQSGLSIQVVQGHKYLLYLVCSSSVSFSASFTGYDSSFQSYFGSGGNITVAAGGYKGILTGFRTGFADRIAWTLAQLQSDISIVLRNHLLIDLTLLFGEGKEPSTVAEFEALYNDPYYPYQPGVIKNNDAVAMESVGFNQWDEETVANKWINSSTGAVENKTGYLCSLNKYRVFPNTTYYIKAPYSCYIAQYDAADNFISIDGKSNSTFTTNSGCEYIRFYVGNSYGTTYNHDICINISDASRNGTYEPYWKKSIQLGLNALRVTDGADIITVNGLKSAGSVYDEIDPVRKKYIKRIGEVDLGGIDWAYSSASHRFYNNTALNNAALFSNADGVGPIICSKYTPDSYANTSVNLHDKSIAILYQSNVYSGLYVYDSGAGTDVVAFKTAMSGVMLQFVLATPVEYDLVDDIPNAIEVDENGTERAIFPEAVDPSAPFAEDSNYSVSTANLVRKLNDAS